MTAHSRIFALCILTPVFFLSTPAFADAKHDKLYQFKTFAAFTTDIEQKNAVYSDHIEKVLRQFFIDHPRMEPMQGNPEKARKELVKLKEVKIPTTNDETKKTFGSFFKVLAKNEVDGLILADFHSVKQQQLHLSLSLFNVRTAEILNTQEADIENPYFLENITRSVIDLSENLLSSIPFDATIIKQDGYRVILNRGGPDLSPGMKISAFTIDNEGDNSTLTETGVIEITDAEENISFGKVLVEKNPFKVQENNKILLPTSRQTASLEEKTEIAMDRMPFFYRESDGSYHPRGEFGTLALGVETSILSMNQVSADGTGPGASKSIYPGANLRAEIWLSRLWFADLGFGFGFSSVGNLSQKSNLSSMRGQIGYRLSLSQFSSLPSVHIKGGLLNRKYDVEPSAEDDAFLSTTYSGILLGAGASIPITQSLGLGFDIDGLFFGSVSEEPLKSGTQGSASGWEFGLKGWFFLDPTLDLQTKVSFLTNDAEFSGASTRPNPISSIHQSTMSLSVGLNYYF